MKPTPSVTRDSQADPTLKHVHICERFEDDGGWLEIRLNVRIDCPVTVTGHWKAWGDKPAYHNSSSLTTTASGFEETQIEILAAHAASNSYDKKEVGNLVTLIRDSVRRLLDRGV